MSEGRTDIKKGIFRRVRVLYALFFFVGMLIAGKILYLQYGPKGPALRNKGTTITYERVKLEADPEVDDEIPALTIYRKREVNIETERKPKTRTTEITADEFYVAVLSNEAKVVLAKFKA